MKRSVGVTIIAVLSLIGSILMLIMGILMVALAIFIPKTDANIPPAFFTIAMVMGSIFYFLLGAWGISTGIGLFRLKNWARISIIIFSILLALMSAFSMLMSVLMIFLPIAGPSAEPSAMNIGRLVMGVFWGVQLGIGIWWLVYFTRAKVKAQFVPVVTALSQALPQVEYQMPATAFQSGTVQKPSGRPVSITVIACLLLAGCLFIPTNLITRGPAIFFTKIVFGWPAALIFIVFAGIQLYVGIGLLRLRPVARLVGLVYFAFGAANSAVFFLAPGAGTRMAALIEWQKSLFPVSQFPFMQPQFQFDFTPFYPVFAIFSGVAGVVAMAAQMYFLVTRKAAFKQA